MKISTLLTGKWWLPIHLGLPLVALAGLQACWPVRGELQFQAVYHLYYTAGLRIITPCNHAALLILPSLFLLVLLFSVTGYVRNPARRRLQGALVLLLVAFAVVAAHLYGYDMEVFEKVGALVPEEYRLYLLPGGGGLLILLAVSHRYWLHGLRRMWQWLARPVRVLVQVGRYAIGLFSLLLLLALLGVNLATGIFATRTATTRAQHPNVILIMVDTLRADHMGCYGYQRNTTPNIDRFARESTLFSKAISQAPWTVWSVFSFMTSQYPDTSIIGMPRDLAVTLSADPQHRRYPMLAEVLKDQGYATHAIISNSILKDYPEFGPGFDDYDLSPTEFMNASSSPAVTTGALQRIHAMRENGSFLFLLYVDPHEPYIRHPGYTFTGNTSGPRPTPISHAVNHTPQRPARCQTATRAIDNYDSEIAFTDHYVGQVLDALKAQGRYDNSLIIMLSDHGEELLEHGRLGHIDTLYDEVLNVPMMIKLPGQRQAGVVDGVFPLLDLMPSVLGALRIHAPALHPLGQDVDIAHLQRCADQPIFSTTINGLLSVRTSRSKYILQPVHATQELYQLLRDPWEQHNLTSEQPQEAMRWQSSLHTRIGPPPMVFSYSQNKENTTAPFTKEQLDKLHAIGYLHQ